MSALGSAGTQAAGIWAFTSDGSMSKPLHAGKAAQGGLISAVLAQTGFTGSRYILEAEDGGFFKAFAPYKTSDWQQELLHGLESPDAYEILNVAYKPYPCCRTTHGAIEAALHIQQKQNVPVEQIKRVVIRTYDVAVKQCGFSERSIRGWLLSASLMLLQSLYGRNGRLYPLIFPNKCFATRKYWSCTAR